jgi:hypothetical protein
MVLPPARVKRDRINKAPIKASVLLVVWLLAQPADAHHGWAEFDATQEVTLEGTVADFHFVNPHCVVEFKVRDEKGRIQNGTVSSQARVRWRASVGTRLRFSQRTKWRSLAIPPGTECLRYT